MTEFERCWPWLAASLERYGPTHTKEHVWQRIIDGEAFFFPGENHAFVIEIIDYPTGFRVCNGWLAGGDLEEIRQKIPALEAWAKRRGCHRVIISAREGWERVLPGYKRFSVRISKDL